MTRGALSIVPLLFLLTACGDGTTEPETAPVTVEGFVTSIEDASPIQGTSVRASRTWCKAVDLDFCRDVTETYDSAETDSKGHYRLTIPSGCIDIWYSKPGYTQSGPYPHVYCTPGNTHPDASTGDGDQRVNFQMRPLEPTVIVWGYVTSSVDGARIGGAQISVYSETDAAEPIAEDHSDGITYPQRSYRGEYRISVDCEEVLYVQATRCLESQAEWLNCTDWRDSEHVLVRSDCPGRGSPAVRHRVDFVLDPISE